MRVAVLTGRLAYPEVSRRVKGRARVYVADYDVASLIPVSVIEDYACRAASEGYQVLIVPGMHAATSSQLASISKKCGIIVVKGPKTLDALPEVVDAIASGKLKLEPGGVVDLTPNPVKLLRKNSQHFYPKGFYKLFNGLKIPIRPPPILVLAEVYLAEGLEEDAIGKALRMYREGASAIVLGASADYPCTKLGEIVSRLVSKGVPVGVDTPLVECMEEGLRRGACLLLSAHPANVDSLPKPLRDGVGVVVVPFKPSESPPPLEERVERLASLASRVRSRGYVPILDPVVQPPLLGLAESIRAYVEASRRLLEPLMAGIGNIYELQDADTIGSIALSTAIFAEAGVSLLLVSEESWKARGAVVEAVLAAIQSSLAMTARSPPKDNGVELLVVKEKRPKTWRPLPLEILRDVEVVDASSVASRVRFVRDPLGDVVFYIDSNTAYAVVVRNGKPVRVYKASKAEDLYKALVELHDISRLDHAAYIGYEAHRLHVALTLGKSYVQDEEPITSLREAYSSLIEEYKRVLSE